MLGRSPVPHVPHVPQSFTYSHSTGVLKATSSSDLIRKCSSIVTSAAGQMEEGGGRRLSLSLSLPLTEVDLHLRLIWRFLVLSSQQLVPAGTLGSKPALLLFLLSSSSVAPVGFLLLGVDHHSCPPLMGTLGTSTTGLNWEAAVFTAQVAGRETGAGRRTRSSCYQLDGRTGRGGRRAAEPGQTRLVWDQKPA